MEFDRETKSMIAMMALVAAIAVGMNALVVAEADRSFMSWSVGLFVVAVLFWIWIRRDDLAEKRGESLKAAEEAARQAEELAKKTQAKASEVIDAGKEKIEVLADDVHDYTEEIKDAVDDATDKVKDTANDVAKAVEEAVVSDEPDDLSKVEGIGPVYQQILKDAGVATFAAIAAKTQEELEAIIQSAGKRRPASIETWAEQAALAAKGDWDGLAKLQSELDGGRRK